MSSKRKAKDALQMGNISSLGGFKKRKQESIERATIERKGGEDVNVQRGSGEKVGEVGKRVDSPWSRVKTKCSKRVCRRC